jgi:hypothetical protein
LSVGAAIAHTGEESFSPLSREEFFQMYANPHSNHPEVLLIHKFLPDSSAQIVKSAFAELLADSQLKMITHNYDGVEASDLNQEALRFDLTEQATSFLSEKFASQSMFNLEDYFKCIHGQEFFKWLISNHSDL